MAVRPIPEGFHTVNPYLIVRGAPGLIAFLEQAFDATGGLCTSRPDGTVAHAQLRIGDSTVELSEANDRCPPMPAAIHLYVEDADATYRRALEAGATSLFEPADRFYGDREAGVLDPSGNHWYIATRREDVPPDELARRAAEAHATA